MPLKGTGQETVKPSKPQDIGSPPLSPRLSWDIPVESPVAVRERGCQVGCAPAETCNRVNYPWWPPVNGAEKEEPIFLPQAISLVLESDQPEDCWASTCPQSWKLKELRQKIHSSLVSSRDFPVGLRYLSTEEKLKACNFPPASALLAPNVGGNTIGESIHSLRTMY